MDKKKDESLLNEKLKPLIHAVFPYVLKSATISEYPAIDDEESKRNVRVLLAEIWNCYRAYLELQGAYADLLLTHHMATRYPWRSGKITRSKHLEFVWFQFLNLCYLFREKYKLSANRHNRIMRVFGRAHRENVSEQLKKIDATIGVFVKARGQHVHEWSVNHEHVVAFGSIEMINLHGGADDVTTDVRRHYAAASHVLSEEIQGAIDFMEDFLLWALDGYLGEFASVVQEFNEMIDAAKEGRVRIVTPP